MKDMPKARTWFQWRIYGAVAPDKELYFYVVPWSDPHEHEFAFDFLFETKEEAYTALETFDAKEEAIEEGWLLCKVCSTPIERAK